MRGELLFQGRETVTGFGHKPLEKKAVLALADGTVFKGTAFGAEGESIGEVVFNTVMTGYQEVLTDPSYCGQIVTMTYPLIGNYGINHNDNEAQHPVLAGFVVKEYINHPSNWRSTQSLNSYLKEQGIIGISSIDTRSLTKHIRDAGAQTGVISTSDLDEKRLIQKAREAPDLIGRDLVREVSCQKPYEWEEGTWKIQSGNTDEPQKTLNSRRPKVIVYDYGAKRNILRYLVDMGCQVYIVPAQTPAREVLEMQPHGIMLSNGPGDPEAVIYAIEIVRELIGQKPIFGICLGHQILGLALGGKTYKLKFGHHGGNQPVMDLKTKKIEITTQNHGFALDIDSIGNDVELTHINLNDRTVEGMRHKSLPIFSVQYHPEASPGPHDAGYLFNRFLKMMKNA
jgi:carbamoyl-phosphate synthase small subunit